MGQTSCGECFDCLCVGHPGWFYPGEVEKAAEFKGMPVDDFIQEFCVIDWYPIPIEGNEEEHYLVQVYAPARVDKEGKPIEKTGKRVSAEYPVRKSDRCIFLDRDAGAEHYCTIYEARPGECQRYHCKFFDFSNPSRESIARIWLESYQGAKVRVPKTTDVVETGDVSGIQ